MRTTKSADPRLAVAYIRTSTHDQALGIQAQEHAIVAWAKRRGVRIAAIHVEAGVSGAMALKKRPVLALALEDLRVRGAGVLVVHKRDRLARDVIVAAVTEQVAERYGARVLAAEGGGNGEGPEAALLRTIVDAVAAFERATIAARIVAALQVKRRMGQRIGGIPYGWRLHADGVHLEAEPQEQQVVCLVKRMRDEGHTYPVIAQELAERGYCPRRGGSWYATQLRRIVLHEPNMAS